MLDDVRRLVAQQRSGRFARAFRPCAQITKGCQPDKHGMDIDINAAWSCALWCGVAQRAIRERLADAEKPPMTKIQKAAVISRINHALAMDHTNHPGIPEAAKECMEILQKGVDDSCVV